MTPVEKLVIEMNVIARTNISEIEKKRRMSKLVEEYTSQILNKEKVLH